MTKKAPAPTEHPAPFSVVPYTAGDLDELPQPNGAPYFVMMRDGPWVHKNLLFARVMVPVKEIPTLQPPPDKAKGYLWAREDIPLFPWRLLNEAWAFFRWAWDERKAEAEVDIVWEPEGRERRTARQGFDDGGFRLFVPPQTAQAGGVKLIRHEQHYRGDLVGTIHSHCNGGAYHSGTDTHDAEGHDGLHMTIGRVSANKPEIDVMVAANGVLWNKLPIADYTGHKDRWDKKIGFPEWWKTFHNHAEAVEAFKGQHFAAGSRPVGAVSRPYQPTTQYPGTRPAANPVARTLSPYSNFKLHEVDAMLNLIADGNHLPAELNRINWLLDTGLAFDQIDEALRILEDYGIKNTISFWYQRATISKDVLAGSSTRPTSQEEAYERMLGIWDDEELDADTRMALAQMADAGGVRIHQTPTGVVIVEDSDKHKGGTV